MSNPFGSDPLALSWMLALSTLFLFAVAVPLLRVLLALGIHAYASISGQRHLHYMAARVMPRTAQLIGGLVIGITSIAAPALAASDDHTVASVNLDRDAGASNVPAARHTAPTPPAAGVTVHSRTTSTWNLDRDGGSAQAPATASRTAPHVSRSAHNNNGAIYIVRTGDSLWSIAENHLDDATDAETTEGWKAIWRANRALIGDHPELIHPGQHLMLPPGALA